MNTAAINFDVSISPLNQEGNRLFISINPGVDDADGLGLIRYQWQRSDGLGGWTDIIGATLSSYVLVDQDVGYTVRAMAYFVDGGGSTEVAYSAASATILNVNDAPTGGVIINGSFIEDQVISVNLSALADEDGLPDSAVIAIQWQRSVDGGVSWAAIDGANATSYTLTQADSGMRVRAMVSYTDLLGTAETIYTASDVVANVNDLPVGFVASIIGTATEEQTLTASTSVISDADGLADPVVFGYQWQSSSNGSTWINIADATSSQYTPDDAHVGLQLRVVTRYTDSQGTVETATSSATTAVVAVNDAPVGSLQMLKQIISTPATEFRINTFTDGAQFQSFITALADGGWLVTWSSNLQDGSGWGVYGQRYNSSGVHIGSEFQVNTNSIDNQIGQSVTALSDGGWLVTWRNGGMFSGSGFGVYGVYGQLYNSSGTKIGSEFRVNTNNTDFQGSQSVSALADGGWIVTWFGTLSDPEGIYGQRYSSSGSKVGSEFRVNTYTPNAQNLPSVTGLVDGGWLVTWQSFSQDGSSFGIYGQRYASTGIKVGEEFRVNTNTINEQSYPAVTSLADGGWLVTWQSSGQDGSGYGIFSQRYSSSGSKVGSEFLVNTQTLSDQTDSSVTSLADGGWLVTWTSSGQDGSAWGIYGQRYASTGIKVGSEFQVNTYTSSEQWESSVTALADGGWVVSWTSIEQDGSSTGIYGQRYDVNGNKTNTYSYIQPALVAPELSDFAENKVLYADASLVSDAEGLGMVSWQWQRSTDGGNTWIDISGATGESYTLGDADVGYQVRLKGTYTDGQGFSNTVYSGASTSIINVNDAPVGFVASISGTATEDQVLTASTSVTSDADGLADPVVFSYQWQSSSDGVTWTNVSGATNATYTLGDADVGLRFRVVTSYTDGQGTVETATSSATTAVANVNDLPTGFTVSLSGSRVEDQTLTGSVGTISDADGTGVLSYQWQRSNDAGGWDNISGATSISYTLGDGDVLRQVRLRVSYVDGKGTTETAFSNPTAPITNVEDEATGTLSVTGTAAEGGSLTASLTGASDLDGAITDTAYQWQISANGIDWTNISGATSATYNLALDQSQVGQFVRVVVTTTDALGGTTTFTGSSTAAITNVNDSPVGFVASIIGTATEEQTLTASTSVISDADGLADPVVFGYQWQSSSNGSIWVDIAGATLPQYTPDDAQNGLQLRVVTRYIDSQGTVETVTSSATTAVAAVNDAPTGLLQLMKQITVSEPAAEFQVNTYTVNSQTNPSVAALADGGWIVTWISSSQEDNTDGSSGVYGQRYSKSGELVGAEFQVNTYTLGNQSAPSVTSLLDGGWLVTWQSRDQDGSGDGIYGQRYSNSGELVGTEFQVNTYTLGNQSAPSITSLLDGGWIVTWSGSGSDDSRGIYGQRYSSSGTKVSAEFRVNTSISSNQSFQSVTALADGGWFVTWQSEGGGQDGSGRGIYGQLYNSSGTKVGAELQINTHIINDQLYPSVTALADGGWLVTWQSLDQDGSSNGIYGQRYATSGLKVGAEFQVNTFISNAQDNPSVTALADGGWLVTWSSMGQDDGGFYGIYGQRYSISGALVGSEFQINTYTTNYQQNPSVTALEDGGWIVTWESSPWPSYDISAGQDGSLSGIYAQRYDVNGQTTNTYNLLVITSTSDFIENRVLYADSSLISDADGLGTISWQWQRSTDGGSTWVDISGATGNSYTLGDADVGYQVRLKGTYTDGQGFSNTVYSGASTSIINVNDAPVGFVASISGTATEDQALTASTSVTSDADGLADPVVFSYQWQSSSDGVTWTNVSGATNATYTLGDADVGLRFRVVTSYTDGQGTVETATSSATTAVANVNDLPTGFTVSLSGSRVEDQTLTGSVGTISDADGTGVLSYQWQRSNDAGGWDNISGATSISYTLGDGDVLRQVRLRVSYVDGKGTTETAFSNPTAPITNVEDEATGTLSVTGTAAEGGSLTASLTGASDPDGAITNTAYQWQISSNGIDWTNISGATSATYNLALDQSQVGQFVRVVVTTTDVLGGTTTFAGSSTAAITNVNDSPVGFVASISGTATEEQTLTASASVTSDEDGLADSVVFSYQWQSSIDGTIWIDIADATSAQYTPEDAQNGLQLRVVARYTDGQGTVETATSSATTAVVAVNDAPMGSLQILSQVASIISEPVGEFRVNTTTSGDQRFPSVSSLADGGWIVIWGPFSGNAVYGQRFSSSGEAVDDEFRIGNSASSLDALYPSVTSLADGGWLTVWMSYRADEGGNYGVYAQRYSSSGAAIGGEFRVNTFTTNKQASPSVSSLKDGGWVIVWESYAQDNGVTSGIYGQRYDSAGNAVGSEFRVNTYTANSQANASVITLVDGGWLVTWASFEQDGSNNGIYGQRYSSTGTLLGSEFRINSYTAFSQNNPSIAALSDGGWLVVWQSSGQDGSGWGIYGQRYNSSGAIVGNEFRVNTNAVGDQVDASVTSLADGGWLVTWSSFEQDGSSYGIYSQRYDSSGGAIGSETLVNTYITDSQAASSVSALADGGWLVAWGSNLQDGTNYGIYAQRYDEAGNKAYTYTSSATVASIADFTENRTIYADSSLISDADGLGRVFWQWQRSTDGGSTWADISGATGNSYTLGDADVGYQVRLKGTYTDGQGFSNTVYSGASTSIINVNDAPVGFVASISGTATEDQMLTASTSVTSDADGLADPVVFSYQWQSSSDGVIWTNVSGATNATYTLGDADVGLRFRVVTSYTDGQGTVETTTSRVTTAVVNVNDAPVGFMVGISGTATEEHALTAEVSVSLDADGLADPVVFSYQWQSSSDGTTWADVAGATSAQYTPDDAQNGLQLRVVTRYTDGQGTTEAATSSGTTAVLAVNDAPSGFPQMLKRVEQMVTEPAREFQANTYTANDQASPSVTALTDGGWVVTWASDGQDGSNYGIYGQRYSSTGAKTGVEFQVNTYITDLQGSPSVTALPDGGWVVTWASSGQDGLVSGIYGQRYSSTGAKTGAEFQINTGQYKPSVTALADGGWVVAWESYGQDGSSAGIYGQRYSSTGAKTGPEFQVNTYITDLQGSPSVTALADGGWVVTWQSYGQDGPSFGIYGQRYSSAGTKTGAEFQINTYTAFDQSAPSVTALADGGWVVTWMSNSQWNVNSQDGSSSGIYGQRFNSAGAKTGAEFRVNTYTTNYQASPSVAATADGGWVVIWESDGQDGPSNIYGQRYSSTGAMIGTEFRVNTYTTSYQLDPSVTALADGGWVVTWSSLAQDGSIYANYGIFGQRYYADGSTSFTYTQQSFVSADISDFAEDKVLYADASLVSDTDGMGTVAWQWQRSPDGGISWADISGAAGDRYTLSDADVGYLVRLKGTYTDGQGFENTVYSAASTPVINVADAPTVTASQSVSTAEDTAKTVTVTGSDVDGDSLTYSAGAASHGTVTGGAGGVFSYTPNSNYVGSDSFIVTVSDGNSGTTTQTVNVTVTAVEDEATGTLSVTGTAEEGGSLTASLTGASDPDGVITDTAYQWQISSNGTDWTNISGATSATYALASDQSQVGKFVRVVVTTTDALGGTTAFTGASSAAIANVNDAPTVSASQSVSTAEDTAKTVTVTGSDVDGDSLTYSAGAASHGTVTGGAGGVFSYTPNSNYVGSDSFIVTVSDGNGGTTTQTVNVTVTAVEDEATGTLSVTGTAAEGGSLTASLTGASDPDGVITDTAYQWQISSNGTDWTNISGATSATYALASDQSQVGQFVRVVVTTTDALGGTTAFTGSSSAAIANIEDEATGTLSMTGTVEEGGSLTASLTGASDLDGAITGTAYQWQISSNGTDWTNISGSTSATYNLASDQTQVGQFVRVVVTTTDALGGTTAFTGSSSAAIANVNDLPAGGVVLSGQANERQTLTAVTGGLSDPDGLGSFSYQWQQSTDGLTWTAISGATGGTYTLTTNDIGSQVRVIVSYTDGFGTAESVTSGASAVVAELVVNEVAGTSGADTLTGLSGVVNVYTGGGSNDSITGKDRADVAVYTGNRSDYTVTTVAGVITVVDNRPGSPDGTDTVRGMNILRFADSQLFVTAAANRTTLAGVAQTFEVANSEFVTGTAAAERFIIHSGVSAFVSAGTGDTVDLAGAITDYTYKASGNQLQISDGVNTTVLTVGGAFTLRTASGSTPVVLDFAAGGVIKLGTQVVGSVGFDAAAAITNVGNTSSAQQGVSTIPPTVTALTGSSDTAPTLTGTAVLGEGQTLEVTVNGVTYTTATGVVLGAANTWSLTLPSALAAGTYSVEAVIVPGVDTLNPVAGTSGADTLTGLSGVVNVYTGGSGNDSITGKDRADVAVYTGNRSDYTVTTVAGVITVVDNRPGSPDGTDTVRGMNILRFADSQLFVTAAANRTTLAGVAQTFEVANSEFVTGTAAAERFIIHSGVSAFVSAGTGDTVDLAGAITDYTYKASGNQLLISDGVNTTVLTVGGAFTLRTASGSTPVVLDFAAGGVIKLGTQVVGSVSFDAAAAITNVGNISDNAIPAFIADTSSNELVITDPSVVITNGGVYTATAGKVDTFIIDANQTIAATIIGFEAGDVIEIENSLESLGVNFDNLIFGDGNATIFVSDSVTLSLTGLANDAFGDEPSFESIYGSEAISYMPIPMSLSMTPSSLSEPTASDSRLTPTTMPVNDLDAPLAKIPVMFMPAIDDLDQLLAYGTAAGGDSIHVPIEGFWTASLLLGDFAYPESFDLYSLRTPISSPVDAGADIL